MNDATRRWKFTHGVTQPCSTFSECSSAEIINLASRINFVTIREIFTSMNELVITYPALISGSSIFLWFEVKEITIRDGAMKYDEILAKYFQSFGASFPFLFKIVRKRRLNWIRWHTDDFDIDNYCKTSRGSTRTYSPIYANTFSREVVMETVMLQVLPHIMCYFFWNFLKNKISSFGVGQVYCIFTSSVQKTWGTDFSSYCSSFQLLRLIRSMDWVLLSKITKFLGISVRLLHDVTTVEVNVANKLSNNETMISVRVEMTLLFAYCKKVTYIQSVDGTQNQKFHLWPSRFFSILMICTPSFQFMIFDQRKKRFNREIESSSIFTAKQK